MLAVPYEYIRKLRMSFRGDKDNSSDAVVVANIISVSLVVIVLLIMMYSFLIHTMDTRQVYEVDIELEGNITMPDYVYGFENITFTKMKVRGKVDTPVYVLRRLF